MDIWFSITTLCVYGLSHILGIVCQRCVANRNACTSTKHAHNFSIENWVNWLMQTGAQESLYHPKHWITTSLIAICNCSHETWWSSDVGRIWGGLRAGLRVHGWLVQRRWRDLGKIDSATVPYILTFCLLDLDICTCLRNWRCPKYREFFPRIYLYFHA